MLRRLSVGLLASAVALAPLPVKAQDGSAEDLGDVMSISLRDVVMTTLADQCALRVANAGSGVFGWLGDAANDLAIGDTPSYGEFLDTHSTADFSWRFGINGSKGNKLNDELSGNLHPSSFPNSSETDRYLHLCLAGMTQPLSLPPLPLPPLKE